MAVRMRTYYDKAYKGKKKDFLNLLKERIDSGGRTFVVTANPEIFMLGRKLPEMNEALSDEETLIVPDGIGVIRGGKQLGYEFEERIPGVEICEELFAYADQKGRSLYLFGAEKSVLEDLAARVRREYPNAVLAGCTDGYVQDKEKVFREIVEMQPDIVLVALGAPKQELLIHRYYRRGEKGVFIGVGGSFDVLSGRKKRAPSFFIRHNLEWLYRIASEPKRLKRFWDSNIKFLFELRKEKHGNR